MRMPNSTIYFMFMKLLFTKYVLETFNFLFPFQLYILRKLMQGDERNPKAPLGNNFRPPLPLNRRALRSNINFIRQDVSLYRLINMCTLSCSIFVPVLEIIR